MILNAVSIDVEEYFHVTDFEKIGDKSCFPSRLRQNVDVALDLLGAAEIRATFFVLAKAAEKHPDAIKKISDLGHEIASHGYGHHLIYNQSPAEFKKDVEKSKKILEDITGREVTGYRAPTFSITMNSLWAIDTLIEVGFKYDSSIFPIMRKRYGIKHFNRFPVFVQREGIGNIIEVPLSTYKFMGINIPFSGGGYLRLLPYKFIRYCVSCINEKEKMPCMIYFHPWELDPEHPKINTNPIANFRHYHNLNSTKEKVKQLLGNFKFTTISEVIENLGDIQSVVV